jgi:uncharacterized protein
MPKHPLIIFAREPEPGQVKTRLAPFMGETAAAELYSCMLIDTVAKATALPGVVPLIFAAGEMAWFRRRFPEVRLSPQQGGDLGERMEKAFADVFAGGAGPVCIVGSDSPDLPPEYVMRAFAELESADIVFGPSEDGGYYLLGMRRLHRELFRGIAWSTGDVLERSLRIAEEAGLKRALLPEWYDVDVPEDLVRPSLAAGENGAVRTGEFLQRMRPESQKPESGFTAEDAE